MDLLAGLAESLELGWHLIRAPTAVGRGCYSGAGGQTCTILPQAMFFVDLAA
jgi:hypothetical protein